MECYYNPTACTTSFLQAIAAMADIKLDSLIRSFDGAGSVEDWIAKVKHVCTVKKITDVASVLPLFLEGSAFAVFKQLPDADQLVSAKIERALLDAFALDPFCAFEKLASRRWSQGEPVDVYLADLKRLAGLADVACDKLLQRAFVVGLPSPISSQLRAAARLQAMTLAQLVEHARVLMASQDDVTALISSTSRQGRQPNRQRYKKASARSCFRCGDPGHFIRDCPQADRGQQQGNEAGKL